MSGHIGVLGHVCVCILLIFGVLFKDESGLMILGGKARRMAQEDDSDSDSEMSNCSSTPKGPGNGDGVSGRMVNEGKWRWGRERASGVDQLARIGLQEQQPKELPRHLSPSPVLPVNPRRGRERISGVDQLARIGLEEQQTKELPRHLSPSPVLPVNPRRGRPRISGVDQLARIGLEEQQTKESPCEGWVRVVRQLPAEILRHITPRELARLAIEEYARRTMASLAWAGSPSQVQGDVSNSRSLNSLQSSAYPSSAINWNMPGPSGMNLTRPSPGCNYQQPFPVVSFPSASCSSPLSSLMRVIEPPHLQVSFPSASCSSPLSSLMRVIEPPSNQINSDSLPQQDQRVGSKRPYPSSVEPTILNSLEMTPTPRDGLLSRTSRNRESNKTLPRDFLSLAPPALFPPATTSRISRFRRPNTAAPIPRYPVESIAFESLLYQLEAEVDAGDRIFVQGAYRWRQRPVRPYHDFFPSATEQTAQTMTSNSNSRSNGSEGEDSLDLELWLRPGEPSKQVEDDRTQ